MGKFAARLSAMLPQSSATQGPTMQEQLRHTFADNGIDTTTESGAELLVAAGRYYGARQNVSGHSELRPDPAGSRIIAESRTRMEMDRAFRRAGKEDVGNLVASVIDRATSRGSYLE